MSERPSRSPAPAPPARSPTPNAAQRSPLLRSALALGVALAAAFLLFGERLWSHAPPSPAREEAPGPAAITPSTGDAAEPAAALTPLADAAAADAAAAAEARPLGPLPAFDSGFCPTPGEEPLDTNRPSMAAFYRAHAGRPEAQLLAAAVTADRKHDHSTARRDLAAAMRLQPDPVVALPLGLRLANTVDLPAAIEALDAYLRDTPSDLDIARLRARLRIQDELQRDFAQKERYGVTLLWPPGTLSESDASGLLQNVSDALDRAARLTETRRRPELTVVLYRDSTDLRATTCAQLWTDGGFDGTLRLVYAPGLPGGVRRSHVTHETLHAQVREWIPSVPVWFHEALAQYFAEEEGAGQRRAWAFMVKNQTFIPFASINGSFMDFPGHSDAALAYSQSLGMLLLLIERNGAQVIPEGVRLLGSGTRPEDLFGKLARPADLDEHDLLAFLARRG